MLAWAQLEVEGCRHFEDGRGAVGSRLSVSIPFESFWRKLTVGL